MEQIEILKRAVQASELSKQGKPYYSLYPVAVENMDSIRVHAEKGVFPDKIFANRSPNQTEEEAKYIKATYKQVTLPVFMDYISTVSRAFSDANWSISYGVEEDKYITAGKTFQHYIEKEIKIYGSIENYVKSIIPTIKAIDAMGVIAVKPSKIDYIETSEGAVIDPDKMIEPAPFYYTSAQVVDYIEGEYYLIETNEKSLVDYGGRKELKGKIYEAYDKDNIYRIIQVGKYTDNKFELQVYFNHNLNKVPVTRLKGIPKIEDSQVLWQSPFLFAVDNLDLVAMNASNLQISISKCVYPYAILLGDECEFEDEEARCVGGYIFDDGKKRTCPSCNGSGIKSRLSVMGQMIVKAPTRTNQTDELNTSYKPIEFVAPPVDTLEFLEKNIERNENRARKILHLQNSTEVVQFNAENTATGSSNNLKALYAFVKTVSDQTFEIYEFILNTIGEQRYGKEYKGVTLVYPNSFDFLTDEDYMAQISEATKAGLPPFVIHAVVYKYLKALYFNEKKTADVFNLIINTDRLLTLSNDDIALKLAKGTVAKWEEILHTSAITFVGELETEIKDFFSLDFLTQKQKLVEKAKLKEAELKPQETGSIVDKILNGSN